jgi:hypothetical protein
VGSSSSDRITRPDDLSGLARDTEREFTAASSDIRRVLPIAAVPWLIATHEELLALPLDGRAGFVLSLIDGRCTVEMILDIAGLPEDEAIDILNSLRQLGVIELHDSHGAPGR